MAKKHLKALYANSPEASKKSKKREEGGSAGPDGYMQAIGSYIAESKDKQLNTQKAQYNDYPTRLAPYSQKGQESAASPPPRCQGGKVKPRKRG
jgi:hypothetical protein